MALATALLIGASCAVDTPLSGRDESGSGVLVPAVEAAFELESYRPGDRALLTVDDRSSHLRIGIYQVGPERIPVRTDDVMRGVRVTAGRTVRTRPGRRTLTIPIGEWPSGLYFARLIAPDGRAGFAPFVVAPRRPGVHRAAVVLPTLTWQAYNFRDDDGDGDSDSWYATTWLDTVRLGRAHLDRGVPYGYRYHVAFLNWLAWTGKKVDYLSQLDLERISTPTALARAYDLVVFAGHHEYVTTHEYDLIQGYRDLGGNLMFLSANNFFYRVEREGETIVRRNRWRDLRRPEAALVGVQYTGHQRSPRAGWTVRRTRAGAWIFRGTKLRPGMRFARGGVEIDQVMPSSPAGLQVVAEIPNLFGPGKTAQMTYYETSAGARVFAAGAFHLTRSITSDPVVRRILENLWARLGS